MHSLPEIFHYWSNRHIRPRLSPFDIDSPSTLFRKHFASGYDNAKNKERRFVSLGAGNCDLEIEIALHLLAHQRTDFVIECIDLNATMIERGRIAAADAGVADHLTFMESDLNSWSPAGEYDAAMANQALHHVLNLENLFDHIKRALTPAATFVISDMIGRNGHLRWPEALDIVREFWPALPPSYRFNWRRGYYEEMFEDWDCSVEGFEGVRAQDILPALLDCFHFQFFLPFGNVIDPFVDRAFGYNFDVHSPWDRAFIDQVHSRDQREIESGRLKPTHMLAVVSAAPGKATVFPEHLSPRFCVRSPGGGVGRSDRRNDSTVVDDWQSSWPLNPQQELERLCERLRNSRERIEQQVAIAVSLQQELDERTSWALELDRELHARTSWALGLERQLEERTVWALRLERASNERAAWAQQMERELEERTAWANRLEQESDQRASLALRLTQELEDRTAWALQLDGEVVRLRDEMHRYIHNPLCFGVRLAVGLCNRLKRLLAN